MASTTGTGSNRTAHRPTKATGPGAGHRPPRPGCWPRPPPRWPARPPRPRPTTGTRCCRAPATRTQPTAPRSSPPTTPSGLGSLGIYARPGLRGLHRRRQRQRGRCEGHRQRHQRRGGRHRRPAGGTAVSGVSASSEGEYGKAAPSPRHRRASGTGCTASPNRCISAGMAPSVRTGSRRAAGTGGSTGSL